MPKIRYAEFEVPNGEHCDKPTDVCPMCRSNGQYCDEQYVPVTTIDHIFALLSSPERE